MNRSILAAVACTAALTALLTGCGARDKPQTPTPAQAAGTAAQSAPAADAPKPAQLTTTIEAYYGNENGTALIAKPTKLTYSAEDAKYAAALNSLKKAPDGGTVSLFEGITFRKVQLDKGGLHLDLSLNADGNLGAPGEELMLQALQRTLFQFPEVTSIYVTEDGKQVDSLMGHMELPYPIKRK